MCYIMKQNNTVYWEIVGQDERGESERVADAALRDDTQERGTEDVNTSTTPEQPPEHEGRRDIQMRTGLKCRY